MKFIAAYGKDKAFSLDIVPVNNYDAVGYMLEHRKTPSSDNMKAFANDPAGPHKLATLGKARAMVPYATVMFA